MAKYRSVPYITIGENGEDVFVTDIEVRQFIFWHFVARVQDDDEEYVRNRVAEIIDILENPNR